METTTYTMADFGVPCQHEYRCEVRQNDVFAESVMRFVEKGTLMGHHTSYTRIGKIAASGPMGVNQRRRAEALERDLKIRMTEEMRKNGWTIVDNDECLTATHPDPRIYPNWKDAQVAMDRGETVRVEQEPFTIDPYLLHVAQDLQDKEQLAEWTRQQRKS